MPSNPQIATACPSCKKAFKLDAEMLGRKGKCDACDTKFIITQTPTKNHQTPTASSINKSAIYLLLFVILAAFGYWQIKTSKQPNTTTSPKNIESNETPPTPIPTQETATTKPTPTTPPLQTPAILEQPTLTPLKSTFPVKTQFGKIDIAEYLRTYPDVHQGWMPSGKGQTEEAKTWGNYLGPLGIRIRSHAPQLQGRPAFAALVPRCIQSTDGQLALTAAEVVQIAPGSPSENHLKLGDLIIGIEGEMLKSGNQYRPDWKFMHKDARELQLMLGEKIDQAQARGDVRLTVLRMPLNGETPLPITRQELWRGTGGDQSIGLQSFDVETPGDGYITLESDSFDGAIHGDGTVWLDVTIEGDYGTKKLLSITPESATAGYGRPDFSTDRPFNFKGKDYAESLNLHAHGTAKWLLPQGTKRIKGNFAALSYGKVQPKIHYTNLALPLTGIHQQSVVELRFPIGKTGSFSQTYPKNCPKTELTLQRQTEWLAAQQREDGSWPRLRGYTSQGWDTAWCALALMSSGDPKYDTQIKNAAYKIAYADAPSEWTAERAMRLILLSEYYLRTKDDKIVAGIQAAYYQLLDCCKTDYMAGHKVNGFGYGIAGQHYGTGHLVLGIALASRTPITLNRPLVNNIIRHGGEVCVNGTYAYGRGRRMLRDHSREHSGGNAMVGPGVLGIQIGGGHLNSIKELVERMDASIGDGDNSHATSSLAFIFSSLAIASADENVFLKHMQNFKYKLTIDDSWEGGYLKSAFPLDFQGGEGVTANWIRSAGNILVLNALKKNLAITGKKEFWNSQNLTTTAVSEWGGQVHSYYLRNWCLAKEWLGNKAPTELSTGIKSLYNLPRTLELVPATKDVVLKYAPDLIKQIANNRALSESQRAYAIELICGLDFKIYTELKDSQQQIKLTINLPLHQLNWLDTNKSSLFDQSPFPLQTKVAIIGENLADKVEFNTLGTKDFNLDEGNINLSSTKPLKNTATPQFDGIANIAFKLGDTTISYRRPLKFNTEFSHSNNYNLRRLKLNLRMAPRAYFQSQPLLIAGIPFDCMYPAERMLDVITPSKDISVNIHEGDVATVDIASENFICPWVHSLEFNKPTQVNIVKPRTHRNIIGSINGEIDNLYDHNPATSCDIIADQSKTIIEYDFGNPVTLNGLDANYGGACFMRVWVKNGGNWVPLVWDNYSVNTSHHPTFPDTRGALWRIEIQQGGSKNFQTLRFYHNPHIVFKQAQLPQMKSTNHLPPVQPD